MSFKKGFYFNNFQYDSKWYLGKFLYLNFLVKWILGFLLKYLVNCFGDFYYFYWIFN